MKSRISILLIINLLHFVVVVAQTANNPQENVADAAEATRLAVQVAELYAHRKYDEALKPAKACLKIREKLFSPGDAQLRIALTNLAEVYVALQKLNDADVLFERLIKSFEEFSPNDMGLPNALQRLAQIKFVRGDQRIAKDLYIRALNLAEKDGVSEQEVAKYTGYLAEYYLALGQYQEAELLYQRIISIGEKRPAGKNSEEYKRGVDRYACLLRKAKRIEEAKKLEGDNAIANPNTAIPPEGVVLNGKALSLPKPSYPAEAQAAGVSGTVIVRVVIDERGKVISACAIDGPPLLMRTAEAVAYQAVFTPTKLSGQPVKVSGIITYRFVAN
jgi:TonB family protein